MHLRTRTIKGYNKEGNQQNLLEGIAEDGELTGDTPEKMIERIDKMRRL